MPSSAAAEALSFRAFPAAGNTNLARLVDELPRSLPANCSTHNASFAAAAESSSVSMMHPISANCSLLQDGGSVLNMSSPYSYSLSSPEHESHLHAVYMVGFPTFITVGVLANVVDLWVLAQSSMQGIAFRYLARLAASDLLYLLFNIPFCLEEFAFTSDGLPVSESAAIYYAYIAVPVVNFFLTLSVYIIVWLSYDRWLAVCNPHKFPTQQTLMVVHRRCVATFLVTFAMYVPCPLRQTYTCYPSSNDAEVTVCCVHESEYMGHQWYYFYEFCREVYSRFLPGILITAFNFAIIWTLRLAKRGKKFSPTPNLGQEIHIQMPVHTSVVSDAKKLEDTAAVVACMGLQHLSLNCCSDIASSPVLLERVELPRVSTHNKETELPEGTSPAKTRAEGADNLCSHVPEQSLSEKIIRSCSVRPTSPDRVGTEQTLSEKIVRPCSIRPISPDRLVTEQPLPEKMTRPCSLRPISPDRHVTEQPLPEKIVRPCSIRPISPERSSHDSNGQKRSKKTKGNYVIVNDYRNDREVCLVFLLLAITVFFYISSFPSALYKIIPLEDEDHKVSTFRAVADVLEVSGHVFNFFLYFLLSPEFRKTLLLLIPRPARIDAFMNAL